MKTTHPASSKRTGSIARRSPHLARLALVWLLIALATMATIACNGDDGDDGAVTGTPTKDDGGTGMVAGDTGYRGALVTPPFEKPAFTLTDTSGNPYDIIKETEGSLVLLYLGYTHCPDVCPTHMADIAGVLKELPADVTKKVRVVFVTTDPARDTPEVLRKWLDLFDKSFIGLTGPEDTIINLQKTLGINPASKTDLGGGNYAVNHAAYVIAFTPDNLAHTVYPLGVTEDDWKHDIAKLAKEGWNPN